MCPVNLQWDGNSKLISDPGQLMPLEVTLEEALGRCSGDPACADVTGHVAGDGQGIIGGYW